MDEFETLNHTKWECKYHVVFIPKRAEKSCMQSCDGTWEKYSAN
jgi:REP element-mobilizing transposase RayT